MELLKARDMLAQFALPLASDEIGVSVSTLNAYYTAQSTFVGGHVLYLSRKTECTPSKQNLSMTLAC